MGAVKLAHVNHAALLEPLCLYEKPSAAGTFERWRMFGRQMGLGQRDIAIAARTSQGYISKMESGRVTPKRCRWPDLMRAYRISTDRDWLQLLNAARAQRVLQTPATVTEPLFVKEKTP